ncbi:MAG: RNB domain-containing ribonuclease [Ardenticatenaceae bacterium]|nr:RNB domain-containing ribonuclease [Ardenticatenaceae bacterium]
MFENALQLYALVLYKNDPARITKVGKKIEIETANGRFSVRPKDITLLHPGPLTNLTQLAMPDMAEDDVQMAWELLSGGTTTLAELTELIYEAFTPQTAWAAWQLVADGLYFSGTPDEILAHMAMRVLAEEETRAAKAAEQEAWEAFLARMQKGEYTEEDAPYLNEIANFARGQQERSKVLRALGEKEEPEHAHALLLKLGYWDAWVNPYPARLGAPTTDPDVPLPALLDEERRDLTHLPAFAIDDEGNQDPDDALSWDDGVLWVHIADVAALIPPDSAADLEARGRGANLYLPEGTVYMLPPAATAQLALGLSDVSPAFSFALSLTPEGGVTLVEAVPSWVRATRLTYAEAEEQLTEEPFAALLAASQAYTAQRIANGAVEIDLPEVRVKVVDGVVEIRPLPNLHSRELVRDAMLMTGEAVARFALQNQIPLPFTVQDPPLPADNLPDGLAGEFARRKLMQRSQQSSIPGAHAGLGLPLYVQCTSPLRRYLDLVAHQQLRAFLRGEAVLDEQALMARVGAADAVSGSVRAAERLSIAHWTMVYLQQHSEWVGEGVVVEQKGKRSVVLIPALAWDGRVSGERPLNSAVSLQLTGVNLPQREAFFRTA